MSTSVKYRYEYEVWKGWVVYEDGGSYLLDTPIFSCATEQDAIDAIEYLIEREDKNK